MLASDASAFGFRVAVATMSIAIIAYLEQSRKFFLDQRFTWALISIAIAMNMTSGSSLFSMIERVIGSGEF